MYYNHIIKKEELQDIKFGKARPWKKKKMDSVVLADSLKRIGYESRANRVKWCGTYLSFKREIESGQLRLDTANFCKAQLCPMCSWRKSLKMYHQVGRIMDIAQNRNKELVPLFLTLTVKNCIGEGLSKTLDVIFKGWNKLNNRVPMFRGDVRDKNITPVVKGWFRTLEITYNEEADTFHPHIHAILLIEKNYFKSDDYMTTTEWLQLWKSSAKLDYDPVGDIRRCKTTPGKRKEIAEVAKYVAKGSDYLKYGDEELTDKLVAVLSEALHKRRLVAYGGVMKEIAKEIDADNPDDGDLVNIGEETIRADVAIQIENYRWNFGVSKYLRVYPDTKSE